MLKSIFPACLVSFALGGGLLACSATYHGSDSSQSPGSTSQALESDEEIRDRCKSEYPDNSSLCSVCCWDAYGVTGVSYCSLSAGCRACMENCQAESE